MGVVYAAHDVELREDVAIKLMRPEFDAGLDSARFRREIRLARHIAHPNVCRVYDLFRHDATGRPVYFYAMQLLAGESLTAFLSRCPIDVETAQRLARDIAEGLCAVHQTGVIHRDLKPSNIIVTEQGRAVVTDFGLATRPAASGETQLTASSALVGTPAYMAPELMDGGKAGIGADMYAFGIVLAQILERVSNPPPRFQSAWRRAIAACTMFDPADRCASPRQALRLAEPGWVPSRRLVVGSVSAAAAVSLSALAFRYRWWKGHFGPGATVLIADVQNDTADPQFHSATALLRLHTEDSLRVSAIDPARTRSVLQQMMRSSDDLPPAVAREAAWRMNATAVVFSTIGRVGSDYSLTVQMEGTGRAPQQPAWKRSQSYTARDRSALLSAVRDAAFWIRREAGESDNSINLRDGLPADVSTPSWEALAFFAEAESLSAANRRDEAILKLDSALDRDPGFALASMRKADILMTQQRHGKSMAQWQHTVGLLDSRRVTRREELRIRGMHAYDTGDVEQSGRYFATWALEYPEDWRGYFYRIVPLLLDGYPQEAIRQMEQALSLRPGYSHAHAQIANAAIAMGDWSRAGDAISRLRQAGERERPLVKEAMLQMAQGALDRALACFDEIQSSPDPLWQVRGRLYKAMLHLERNEPDAALRALASDAYRGLPPEADAERASWLLARAFAAWRARDPTLAASAASAAIEVEQGPYALRHAAAVFARVARFDLASAIAERVGRLAARHYRLAAGRIDGEIALAKGHVNTAIDAFRAAFALAPRIYDRTPLARALADSGNTEEARRLFQVTAGAPLLVYLEPMCQEPGAWGDSRRWLSARNLH
jgi:tetratricopeptide (TPR) repeat protein